MAQFAELLLPLAIKGTYTYRIPEDMRTLLQINPVTESVELMRYAILGQGTVNWGYYFLSWGVTLVIALLGIVVFNKVERTFMDTV